MFNSLVASRRLALRLVAVQAAVSVVVAVGFLFQGVRPAIAAAAGGGMVALGSLLMAWRALPAPAISAGAALGRLVSGLLLKWFLVVVVLYLALARFALPPLPLIAGMVAAMAASFLTQSFQAKGVQ